MNKNLARLKYSTSLAVFAVGVVVLGYQYGVRKTTVPNTPGSYTAAPPTRTSEKGGTPEDELTSALSDAALARTDAGRVAAANRLSAIGCGAHYEGTGRGSTSLAALETAGRLYRKVNSPPLTDQVATLATYAEALTIQGRTREAGDAFTEALVVCQKCGDKPLLADIALQYADFLISLGNYGAARRYLVLSRASCLPGDDHRLGRYKWMLGVADSNEGNYAEATLHLRRAEQLLSKMGDADTRAAVWGNLGDVRFRQGRFSDADVLYLKGLSHFEDKKQCFWTGVFLARRARVALATDRLREAGELAELSLNAFSASNGPMARAVPLMVLGEVATRRGELGLAERLLKESLALQEERASAYGKAEVSRALKHLRNAQNDTAAIGLE